MDLRTGELIIVPQAKKGVYTWEINIPKYFLITKHQQRPFLMNQDIINVQVRFNHNLRKELGIHKCFLNFKIWTTLQPLTGLFLRVFRYQGVKFLYNLGVIATNNVLIAAAHVLFKVTHKNIACNLTHEIKFKVF
nr:AC3 [African cassava mosaic virus]